MARHIENGSFTPKHAATKAWRIKPGLMRAFLEIIPVGATVYDIGSGPGHYVRAMRDGGLIAIGIDGTHGISEISAGLVLERRLDERLSNAPRADWGVCIEVGEHIAPGAACEAFLDNLSSLCEDGLIVTWAVPGQRGVGHVNCQPPEWVVEQIEKRGKFVLSRRRTRAARKLAERAFRKKLLVFVRKGS